VSQKKDTYQKHTSFEILKPLEIPLLFILDLAIEREKGVLVIVVHRKLENSVLCRGESLFQLVGDKK